MAQHYYYLISGLPDLFLREEGISPSRYEFREQLKNHISKKDYALVELFFLPIDNKNLYSLISEADKPFIEGGIYEEELIKNSIKSPDDDPDYGFSQALPEYMIRYIKAYQENKPIFEKLSWENQLVALYYEKVMQAPNKFVREYFEFEMNLNNILTSYITQNHNLSPEEHIIGDNDFANALRRKKPGELIREFDFEYFDDILKILEKDNLKDREFKLDQLRWQFINEHTFFTYFTIEKILGFLIKLEVLERWSKLDKERGEKIFRQLIEEMKSSFEFPQEFDTIKKH